MMNILKCSWLRYWYLSIFLVFWSFYILPTLSLVFWQCIAAFCCVGFDIVVPIFPFIVFLTCSCLIYFLLSRALLILFLVWGCAFGLVIPGFIHLALFFLFRCFCSSRWDCCACLFSTLFSLPSIFFNNLSSFSSAGKRIVKPSKVAKDIHTDHVSPFCLSLWI